MSEPLTLNSLPLFPLGTVLYPGGLLPLRVFEVRYLDMIGKCHKTGAPFGVVSLTEGAEVRRPVDAAAKNAPPGGDGFAPEAFSAIGTLATLSEYSAPQSGLMMIRCAGVQRFKISRSEKLRHGLWIADVAQLAGDMAVSIPSDLQKVADALAQVVRNLNRPNGSGSAAKTPMLPPYRLDDCGWVANRWCELLPLPLALKQRLLELDNPLVRLELVCDILERTGISL